MALKKLNDALQRRLAHLLLGKVLHLRTLGSDCGLAQGQPGPQSRVLFEAGRVSLRVGGLPRRQCPVGHQLAAVAACRIGNRRRDVEVELTADGPALVRLYATRPVSTDEVAAALGDDEEFTVLVS